MNENLTREQLIEKHQSMKAQLEQLEKALQESENKYQATTKALQVGIFYTDAQGHCTFTNDKWLEIAGLSAEDALGEGWTRAIHPTDQQLVYEEWYRAIEERRPFKLEYRFQRPDGQVTWVLGQTIAVQGDGQAVTGYVGAITDITKQKLGEEALLRERNFTATILNTITTLVIILDNKGKVINFNHACEETTGFTAEELRGKPLFNYLVLPEERPGVEAIFAQLQAGMFPNQYENYWLTKDGGRQLIDWTNTAILDKDGAVEFVVGTGLNITEKIKLQQQAEQNVQVMAAREATYRALINAVPDLMFQLDAHGIFLDFKGSSELLVPPELFLGKHVNEVLPPHIAQLTLDNIAKVLATKEMSIYEYQLPLADELQDYEVRMVVSGEAIVLAIVRNVTARKQAEIEREQLQQEVIEAQKQAIAELSTPIIPIVEGIMVMPLVGSVDSMRAKDLMRALLSGIRQYRAKIVILDITGVPIVDTGVVSYLDKTIQGARLKGARVIVTGISDAVAEALVDLGIDWSGVETLRDLQTGLKVALNSLGIKLVN